MIMSSETLLKDLSWESLLDYSSKLNKLCESFRLLVNEDVAANYIHLESLRNYIEFLTMYYEMSSHASSYNRYDPYDVYSDEKIHDSCDLDSMFGDELSFYEKSVYPEYRHLPVSYVDDLIRDCGVVVELNEKNALKDTTDVIEWRKLWIRSLSILNYYRNVIKRFDLWFGSAQSSMRSDKIKRLDDLYKDVKREAFSLKSCYISYKRRIYFPLLPIDVQKMIRDDKNSSTVSERHLHLDDIEAKIKLLESKIPK